MATHMPPAHDDQDGGTEIAEWAHIIATYEAALRQAMPHAPAILIHQLVIDWQRLMIERVRGAPDVLRLNLAPGADTGITISRLLTQAFKTHN